MEPLPPGCPLGGGSPGAPALGSDSAGRPARASVLRASGAGAEWPLL